MCERHIVVCIEITSEMELWNDYVDATGGRLYLCIVALVRKNGVIVAGNN
jgi:hypothetical protein